MTNPISGFQGLESAIPATSTTQGPKEWGFVETLRGTINQAEQLQGTADAKVAAVLEGNGMDVHNAMIAVEKADLSFQLMMQVRNKIVAAYQEISRMQF